MSATVWAPSTAISANTKSVVEVFTATSGQEIFNLTSFIYALNTGALEIYVDGLLKVKGTDWSEVSTTSFSFAVGLTTGQIVQAVAHIGITGDVPTVEIPDTTFYNITTTLGATSHPTIVTGHVIRTNYYAASFLKDSGADFKYTGVTTLGKAGNLPDVDGFFYDLDGKQFSVEGTLTPQKFGAVVDGVTDDITAINAAFAAGNRVVLSAGTYATTVTLTLTDNQSLILEAGAKILSSAGTVVHVHGEYITVMGEGKDSVIQTSQASPLGVVLVGHSSIADTDAIQYNVVQNLRIVGADAYGAASALTDDYTVGLMVFNSQAWNSGGYVYYNSFSDLMIQDTKETIVLTATVNANFFNNILIWRAGQAGIHIFSPYSTDTWGTRYGYNWNTATLNSPASENLFSNIFVDTSLSAYKTLNPAYASETYGDGQAYSTEGACLRITGHSSLCGFTNFMLEPGSDVSGNSPVLVNALEIDTAVTDTYIQGAFNVSGLGTTNAGVGVTYKNGAGGDTLSDNLRLGNIYKIQLMDNGLVGAPAVYDRDSVTTGIFLPSVGSMAFSSVGIEKFRYGPNGVLIGTVSSSGSYVLELGGSAYVNGDLRLKSTYPIADVSYNLGTASFRWNNIYTVNAVIVGSDREYKESINELLKSEIAVAKACKKLMRKYKLKESIARKGNEARWHIGIIAQDLEDAFAAEGLDAGEYGMFVCNTWWEADVDYEAIAPVEPVRDQFDELITPRVEGRKAKTVREVFESKEEAPSDAVEITRRAVRYEELLAFIVAGL